MSDAPASDNSGSENISIESINTSDATTQNTETDDKNSNSTFEKDGVAYKTDDNGNVYMTDGKLAPNSTYELNDSTYTTDDKGRITNCEAKPQRSPENPHKIQGRKYPQQITQVNLSIRVLRDFPNM